MLIAVMSIAGVISAFAGMPVTSEYWGNGVRQYYDRNGYNAGQSVTFVDGSIAHYNQFGYKIGYSVPRGRYVYTYTNDGYLIGRTRVR